MWGSRVSELDWILFVFFINFKSFSQAAPFLFRYSMRLFWWLQDATLINLTCLFCNIFEQSWWLHFRSSKTSRFAINGIFLFKLIIELTRFSFFYNYHWGPYSQNCLKFFFHFFGIARPALDYLFKHIFQSKGVWGTYFPLEMLLRASFTGTNVLEGKDWKNKNKYWETKMYPYWSLFPMKAMVRRPLEYSLFLARCGYLLWWTIWSGWPSIRLALYVLWRTNATYAHNEWV